MARIEKYNGYPAIIVDGKPYPPMMATIRTNNVTSMKIDKEYYRNLGKSGIKIFFLICDTEWLKPQGFAMFREEAEILLDAVPDAYIMLRIGMHPSPEWCEQNPDETMSYSDGLKRKMSLFTESYVADYPAMYSLASEKWRHDAGEALKDTIKKVSDLPYADRIIGYFFAAGGTSEWYYMTPTEYTSKSAKMDTGGWEQVSEFDWDNVYADLSPAFRKSFSKYLKETYGTTENMRKSWHDDTVSIEEPRIPDCEGRYVINGVDHDMTPSDKVYSNSNTANLPSNGTNVGHFLDIDKCCDTFDFFRAWHIGVAESVIYFGNVVKSISSELLTGAFYGSAGSHRAYSMGQIGAVTNILDSGTIDFLASPGVYENRQPGGFVGQRQVPDSYTLRNRIFIVEEDARTHFDNPFFARHMNLFSMEDSINNLKRDFGRNICQNLHAWWFDQIIGGGRYKHHDIYSLFERQQVIAHESYEKNRVKNSEIAFIYDEESYHVTSEETTLQMVELFRNYEIDIVGAPSDRYYHNDMANPDMPDYKIYFFMNVFYLSDAEREIIRKKLAKNHATAVFLYAQGLINPDREKKLSADNMSELMGIDIEMVNGIYSGKMKFDRSSANPVAKAMDMGEIYGDFSRKLWLNVSSYMNDVRKCKVDLYPGLFAKNGEGESIAHFLDTGAPAITIKDNGDFTAIYYGSKQISANIVRELARLAGVHIYCDSDDVLYANNSYITFHAATSGKKRITLPRASTLKEVYSGEIYCENSSECEFELLKGETLMFEIV